MTVRKAHQRGWRAGILRLQGHRSVEKADRVGALPRLIPGLAASKRGLTHEQRVGHGLRNELEQGRGLRRIAQLQQGARDPEPDIVFEERKIPLSGFEKTNGFGGVALGQEHAHQQTRPFRPDGARVLLHDHPKPVDHRLRLLLVDRTASGLRHLTPHGAETLFRRPAGRVRLSIRRKNLGRDRAAQEEDDGKRQGEPDQDSDRWSCEAHSGHGSHAGDCLQQASL